MGIVDEALTAALTNGIPQPQTDTVLADLDTRKRLARADAGIDGTQLPPKGTQQRKDYDTAMRRYQRYTTTATERRKIVGDRLRSLLDGVGRVLAMPNVVRAQTGGVDMQLTASIKVSQTWKVHTMPVGDPQHIGGSLLGAALNAWVLGDMSRAGDELLRAFWIAYWGDPEPCELGDIDSCTVTL